MPEFIWNETDFIECLCVIPTVEEYGIAHHYRNGQDHIEFAAAKIFGGRYDGESMIPMGIRISVDPDFNIQLFQQS